MKVGPSKDTADLEALIAPSRPHARLGARLKPVADLAELARAFAAEHYWVSSTATPTARRTRSPTTTTSTATDAGRFSVIVTGTDQTWIDSPNFGVTGNGRCFASASPLPCASRSISPSRQIAANRQVATLAATARRIRAVIAPWRARDPRKEQSVADGEALAASKIARMAVRPVAHRGGCRRLGRGCRPGSDVRETTVARGRALGVQRPSMRSHAYSGLCAFGAVLASIWSALRPRLRGNGAGEGRHPRSAARRRVRERRPANGELREGSTLLAGGTRSRSTVYLGFRVAVPSGAACGARCSGFSSRDEVDRPASPCTPSQQRLERDTLSYANAPRVDARSRRLRRLSRERVRHGERHTARHRKRRSEPGGDGSGSRAARVQVARVRRSGAPRLVVGRPPRRPPPPSRRQPACVGAGPCGAASGSHLRESTTSFGSGWRTSPSSP